jgi:hypothetical protein
LWYTTVWGLLVLLLGVVPMYHSYRTVAGEALCALPACEPMLDNVTQ